MNTKGKAKSRFLMIGTSCDGFFVGCFAMCLLFFAPYAAGSVGTLVVWFLPLACVAVFALMPLVYWLLHRLDLLLFGRYHLAMPLSAFASSFFFVLVWGASDGGAASSAAVFFGILLYVCMNTVYRYCAFSVRARLLGESFVRASKTYNVFAAVGAVAAVVTFGGFWYYDGATAYVNTAFVLSAACIMLSLIQYLCTYSGIPRLGGRRNLTVRGAYLAIFGGLDKRLLFSALLFEAAYAVLAALAVYLGFAVDLPLYHTLVVVAVGVAAYIVSAFFCASKVERRNKVLSYINLGCTLVPSAALVAVSAASLGGVAVFVVITICAAAIGCGSAVALQQTKMRIVLVKRGITSGVAYILYELLIAAAAAIAIVFAAAVATTFNATGALPSFVLGFGAALALGIAAFCLKPGRSMRAPTAAVTYERTMDADNSDDESQTDDGDSVSDDTATDDTTDGDDDAEQTEE